MSSSSASGPRPPGRVVIDIDEIHGAREGDDDGDAVWHEVITPPGPPDGSPADAGIVPSAPSSRVAPPDPQVSYLVRAQNVQRPAGANLFEPIPMSVDPRDARQVESLSANEADEGSNDPALPNPAPGVCYICTACADPNNEFGRQYSAIVNERFSTVQIMTVCGLIQMIYNRVCRREVGLNLPYSVIRMHIADHTTDPRIVAWETLKRMRRAANIAASAVLQWDQPSQRFVINGDGAKMYLQLARGVMEAAKISHAIGGTNEDAGGNEDDGHGARDAL